MRIEPNLTAELDGKTLTIRWKNKKLKDRLTEASESFLDQAREIQRKQEAGELPKEEATEQSDKLLAEFYHAQSDIMFDFTDGTPPVEWFGRDDFPEGQLEFLRQVFTDPQMTT